MTLRQVLLITMVSGLLLGCPFAPEGRAPLRDELSTRDAFSQRMAFQRFEEETKPENRSEALISMWEEARADGTETGFLHGLVSYLVEKAPDDPCWSESLLDRVIELQDYDEPDVRRVLVHVLAKRSDQRSVATVRRLLDDEHWRVRDAAVTGVYRQEGGREVLQEYVRRYADDPDHERTVRRARFLLDKDAEAGKGSDSSE